MALENVANEDLEVSFSNTAGPPDIAYTVDQGIDAVKIIPTKSTHCEAVGSAVCTTAITLLFAVGGTECPHTSLTHTFIAGGGSIAATAAKVKADAQFVLREGDTGTCAGTWQPPGAPPPTPIACTCNLEIADAGQTKVKAQ
ncbi:MAG: hypothetical protein GY832_17965 [Chloroflexi bacterium]|nr:hypothetical protein [Chloroflexota bacterium]